MHMKKVIDRHLLCNNAFSNRILLQLLRFSIFIILVFQIVLTLGGIFGKFFIVKPISSNLTAELEAATTRNTTKEEEKKLYSLCYIASYYTFYPPLFQTYSGRKVGAVTSKTAIAPAESIGLRNARSSAWKKSAGTLTTTSATDLIIGVLEEGPTIRIPLNNNNKSLNVIRVQ